MKKIIAFFMIVGIVFSMQTFSFATEAVLPDNGAAFTNNTTQNNTTQNNTAQNNSPTFSVSNFSGNDEKVKDAVDTAGNFGKNIVELIAQWCWPFCALLIIWGSVQYFILGIRNLYKKRQGLLLMWGSLTFFVVVQFISLILSFMVG